jgi:hypothetical protein
VQTVDHANASALAKHIAGLMAASDCGMAARRRLQAFSDRLDKQCHSKGG